MVLFKMALASGERRMALREVARGDEREEDAVR